MEPGEPQAPAWLQALPQELAEKRVCSQEPDGPPVQVCSLVLALLQEQAGQRAQPERVSLPVSALLQAEPQEPVSPPVHLPQRAVRPEPQA